MTGSRKHRRTLLGVGWLGLVGAAVLTRAVVTSRTDTSPAAGTLVGLTAAVLPGLLLGGCGLHAWTQHRDRSGGLLLLAGVCWQLALWNDPAVHSSLMFTAGLALAPMVGPLVAHHRLCFPRRGAEQAVLLLAYALAALQGLVPAVLADPARSGCSLCATDLLALSNAPGIAQQAAQWGWAVGVGWSAALAILVLSRLVRAAAATRRRPGPASVAAAVFLTLQAWSLLRDAQHGPVPDPAAVRLFEGQALALLALAAATAAGWSIGRRARHRVARLVLELDTTQARGDLRQALASSLRDPSLALAYVLDDGAVVDVRGVAVQLDEPVTRLTRGRTQVAVLRHRAGLLDEPATVQEITRASRLVLDNERLQAELAVQLRHLIASRRRIVATGDLTRRRLERNVHDGAQQRLVALLLDLRLGKTRWPPSALEAAEIIERELLTAIEELRTLAQGIFPTVLAEEGLAEAVQNYAEASPVPILVAALPQRTHDPIAESAAWYVLTESVRRSTPRRIRLRLDSGPGALRMLLDLRDCDQPPRGWLVDLEDRVGAAAGELVLATPAPGHLELRMELPCASS